MKCGHTLENVESKLVIKSTRGKREARDWTKEYVTTKLYIVVNKQMQAPTLKKKSEACTQASTMSDLQEDVDDVYRLTAGVVGVAPGTPVLPAHTVPPRVCCQTPAVVSVHVIATHR